jgi:hypothetical protein
VQAKDNKKIKMNYGDRFFNGVTVAKLKYPKPSFPTQKPLPSIVSHLSILCQ